MSNKNKDLQNLLNLKTSQSIYINWLEDGGWEVQRVHDVYVLFEIPQYGGNPYYINTYCESQLFQLIDTVYNWT